MFHAFTTNGSAPEAMAMFAPFLGLLIAGALIDVALKGWGMWRAAKMGKTAWFIALLLVNSLGILPIIFLLLTKEEYEKVRR